MMIKRDGLGDGQLSQSQRFVNSIRPLCSISWNTVLSNKLHHIVRLNRLDGSMENIITTISLKDNISYSYCITCKIFCKVP